MGSREMMTMLLPAIFLLFASTFAQEEDCPANPNSPSCDDPTDQTICQLTCHRASDTCTRADEAKCGQIGVDVTSETHMDMFSKRCRQICAESRDADAANACRFYKVSDFGKEVVCSLMDDTQCTATGPCGSHCESDDVGCKGTPIPGLQECQGNFVYTSSAFHFGCDHCNPYSDLFCEEGNKCFTTERCSKWDGGKVNISSQFWRKLAIECTRFGSWARLEGSDGTDGDYTNVLNGTEAPNEPTCKPLPVEILPGVLTEDGADFHCDKELKLNEAGTHLEIVAPNTCYLHCDFHLSMSLDCRISDDGETECYDEGDPNLTPGENIYCWLPPTSRPTLTTITDA